MYKDEFEEKYEDEYEGQVRDEYDIMRMNIGINMRNGVEEKKQDQ